MKTTLSRALTLASLLIATAAVGAHAKDLDPKTLPGLKQAGSLSQWSRYFDDMREMGIGPNTIGSLRGANPNLYVFTVQTLLKERGAYDGPISGLMTRATITAIYDFCEGANIAAKCVAGPMDYGTAYNIAYVLIPYGTTLPRAGELAAAAEAAAVAESTPAEDAAVETDEPTDMASAPATATPAEAEPVEEAAPQLALPEGWQSLDAGGVTHEVVAVNTTASPPYVDIRYVGTPEAAGDFNLRLASSTPVSAGQIVSATVETSLVAGNSQGLRFGFRIALRDAAGTYLGEAEAEGVRLQFDTGAPEMSQVSGPVIEGAALAQPYLKIVFEPGPVDVTLRLTYPQVETADAPAAPDIPAAPDATDAPDA